MGEFDSLNLHIKDPDIFREALSHSEAATGFTANLIEKDYYCSVVLQYLFQDETSLVFKGGTCLGKVYTDFYRLSADLDFIVPIATNETRSQRRARMAPIKHLFNALPTEVPGVDISQAFRGHNDSRQYIGYLEYQSAVIEKQETIKIEVGLREPLLAASVYGMAETILVSNPFTSPPDRYPAIKINAMAMEEAYAEKVHAALTRREPAIRDYFDLFRASREVGLDFSNPNFINMVRDKLKVPGNEPIDISSERKQELERQLDGQLKPVLRPDDFERFNLDEAFDFACEIAKAISI